MSGFFFTPTTRFYAEMMQGMGSTGSGVYAGNGTEGSFFGTVQDKLSQMEADPAYEKWVLDTLRSDFSCYNPWSSYYGGSYRSHYFGATKEEYRGESFHMGFRNGDKRTESKKKEESFWDKRAKRHKLNMDLAQKAWYKHESERKYQESIDLHRRELSSARLQQWSLERATGEKVELDVNPSVLSEAATEYAQAYVFFKIPSALMNRKAMRSATK